jgi:hypothetical protein
MKWSVPCVKIGAWVALNLAGMVWSVKRGCCICDYMEASYSANFACAVLQMANNGTDNSLKLW